jgi:hypothetical protein
MRSNEWYAPYRTRGADTGRTKKEKEWGAMGSRFVKAELKRGDIGDKELAERLTKYGLEETETSIAGKLARGTLPRLCSLHV